MRFPSGALFDPPAQQGDFAVGDVLVRTDGRHALVGVLGREPVDQGARLGIARHDGQFPALKYGRRPLARVQPEPSLPRPGIRTVAGVAPIREHGTDVPVVVDQLGQLRFPAAAAPRGKHRREAQQGNRKMSEAARHGARKVIKKAADQEKLHPCPLRRLPLRTAHLSKFS